MPPSVVSVSSGEFVFWEFDLAPEDNRRNDISVFGGKSLLSDTPFLLLLPVWIITTPKINFKFHLPDPKWLHKSQHPSMCPSHQRLRPLGFSPQRGVVGVSEEVRSALQLGNRRAHVQSHVHVLVPVCGVYVDARVLNWFGSLGSGMWER